MILEVNRIEVGSRSDVEEALEKQEDQAVLLIQRGQGTLYLPLEKE